MTMERKLTPVLGLLITLSLQAQEPLKRLTLSDAVLKAHSDLAPQHLDRLDWVTGSGSYSYLKGDSLMRNGVGKMADRPVIDLEGLRGSLPPGAAEMERFPAITWQDPDHFTFSHNDRVYSIDLTSRTLQEQCQLLPHAENQDAGPNGRIAYTVDNDLYISIPGTSGTIKVTNDGGDGIVNGKSVHRQEYGIEKGTFWSPQGNLLAFYRMDETMVTPYMLEEIESKPSTFKKIRYPMAGQNSHEVKVGVFDLRTKEILFLNTGEPKDQYLTNLAWSTDERYLFVTHLDRATTKARLVQYDVTSGNPIAELISDTSSKYVEPLHPPLFVNGSRTSYIWWSQRDGWMHLYLYDLKKGLVRQLTSGNWVVKEILGQDPKGSYLVVAGTADDPGPMTGRGSLETFLYRVDLRSGAVVQLTRDPGTHHGELNKDATQVIDRWSSTSVPGRTEIIDVRSGQVLKTLVDAPDPLAGYRVGSIELLSITGEFGDPLNARLIKPSGFQSRARYPVIVYVYNGPHVQLVSDSWLGGAPLWMLEAAERGYLVFTVDGHGSDDRGLAFEQAVYRHLGAVEMKDQLHGVDYLRGLPYVDRERMAVHGWSFGGFMATSLMLKAPGVFKVAVAGGPVMDWSMYEVMYTERYMDKPEENPDGYAQARLTDKCGQLQGDLLVIHGLDDETVLPEHSYRFLQDCVKEGRQVDFFVYPGHPHNVRGKDRVHLMTKVLDHIDRALGMADGAR
ncbi:MAG: DPP IV N-terminal domain-containing protein [Flavobacteriales bacterium]|nr:DPP IV N-terminal domain-containing protein [Flavobacteriales bacterium]MCB9167674.1 DPP IV N-terminal domain-containing protein [Flavobacteriales bacterium]